MKRAFDHAYIVLTNAVNPLSIYRDCTRFSILGRILQVTDDVIRYRKWVEDKFGHLPTLSPIQYNQNNQGLVSKRTPRSLSSGGSSSSESGDDVSSLLVFMIILLMVLMN